MKMDTAVRVQVDGSAMCAWRRHCSSGVGGELNYRKRTVTAELIETVTLDVAGANSNGPNRLGPVNSNSEQWWALDVSGAQDGLDLAGMGQVNSGGAQVELGLEMGLHGCPE